jgi:hypothetical protein
METSCLTHILEHLPGLIKALDLLLLFESKGGQATHFICLDGKDFK